MDIIKKLREQFPHGHPDFIPLTLHELQLHSDKNHDYAHGGDPLGNFKRRAAILSLYPGLDLSDPTVVAMIDQMKQMDAALWQLSQGFEAKVENFDKRQEDVGVYAKIARILKKGE
jgi:hypothetical protein